ncbi:MAG TPA: GntR family transcriptional regulator [Clostridiaceae bacterium]|nr:GntR family transcriptional regulator [Clostridiaceae bacterium]
MSYKFLHDIPIYLQIIDIFRGKILRGELMRGDQMPSVRDVAMEYGVNPNTVQRAFSEMDRLKLTRSERTAGRFVIASDQLIRECRKEESKNTIKEFIAKMKALGVKREEIIEIIEMIEKGWIDE